MGTTDYVWAVFYVLILVSCFLLNGLVLVSVFKYRHTLYQTRLIILFSLAVADLLKVVPLAALIVAVIVGPEAKVGRDACSLSSTLSIILIAVTAVHLAMESLNRLVSLVWPFNYEKLLGSKLLRAVLPAIWILPILGILVPPYLIFPVNNAAYHSFRTTMYSCTLGPIENENHSNFEKYKIFAVAITTIFLALPFAVMVISYSIIFKITLKHISQIKRIEKHMAKLARERRNSISDDEAWIGSPTARIHSPTPTACSTASTINMTPIKQGPLDSDKESPHLLRHKGENLVENTGFVTPSSCSPAFKDSHSSLVACTLIENNKENAATLSSERNRKENKQVLSSKTLTDDNELSNNIVCSYITGGATSHPDVETLSSDTPNTDASNDKTDSQDKQFTKQTNIIYSSNQQDPSQYHQSSLIPEINVHGPPRYSQPNNPDITITTDEPTNVDEGAYSFIEEFSVMAAWAEILRRKASEEDQHELWILHLPDLIKEELKAKRREIQLAMTLGGLLIAFIIFYTPMLTFSWNNILSHNHLTSFSFDLGRFLIAWAFLNSTLNPLIYCLRVPELRKAVNKIRKQVKHYLRTVCMRRS